MSCENKQCYSEQKGKGMINLALWKHGSIDDVVVSQTRKEVNHNVCSAMGHLAPQDFTEQWLYLCILLQRLCSCLATEWYRATGKACCQRHGGNGLPLSCKMSVCLVQTCSSKSDTRIRRDCGLHWKLQRWYLHSLSFQHDFSVSSIHPSPLTVWSNKREGTCTFNSPTTENRSSHPRSHMYKSGKKCHSSVWQRSWKRLEESMQFWFWSPSVGQSSPDNKDFFHKKVIFSGTFNDSCQDDSVPTSWKHLWAPS